MLRRRVNGYDMAYIELGEGRPLVCVHGTLGDFRVWSPVSGPLSRRCRVFALSLRHFFPEPWEGGGSDFTIAQHVADVIGFIEGLRGKPAACVDRACSWGPRRDDRGRGAFYVRG